MFPIILSLWAQMLTQTLPAPKQVASKGTVSYDRQCFTVNGKDMIVYSGAFHYFRCPQPLWKDRLLKIREAHFNCVETYIAWDWHEQQEGKIDLKEFEDFLKLCEQMGIYVIARPGPYICAEWDEGGFPTWLPAKIKTLRDNGPDSLKWSKYWYDAVLPIIKRHQIHEGGTIIMCQLENEYDFYPGTNDKEKTEYVRSLFKMAKAQGLTIPLITSWTHVVRNRADPDMKQIMDSCNFYPGLNVGYTVDELAKLRREQPDAPLMVTELQGGWFSEFGGGLSRDRKDVTASQQNAIIKTVWAGGATSTNYYMLFGGTNFGYWGAKNITSTYDYAAPMSEPGGLWDKYYVVKAAGKFAEMFGTKLARAEAVAGATKTDMEGVFSALRTNGKTGFLFLRNDRDTVRKGTVTVNDTASGISLSVDVTLEPRGAKVLPINAVVGLTTIVKTSGEITGAYKMAGDRDLIVVCGEPGTTVVTTFGTLPEATAVIPLDASSNPDRLVSIPGGPLVLFTTTNRAARMSEFPNNMGSWPVSGGFYRLAGATVGAERLTIEAEVTPTAHFVSLPLPRAPKKIQADGKDIAFTVADNNLAQFVLTPPPAHMAHIAPLSVQSKTEQWGEGGGWKPALFQPLDEQGVFENGYTRYRGQFDWKGQKELLVSLFSGDPVLVAVNGKPAQATVPTNGTAAHIHLTGLAKPGKNVVELLYENTGRTNFGLGNWSRKGVKTAVLVADNAPGMAIPQWRFHKSGLPTAVPAEAVSTFDDSSWRKVGIGNVDEFNGYKGWGWYRANFSVSADDLAQGRTALYFEMVDDNAIVFINGQRLGEHRGWDEPFSLDAKSLLHAGDNTIAIAVENTDGPGGVVKPVTLTKATAGDSVGQWELADRLEGQRQNWPVTPGGGWKTVSLPEASSTRSETVHWYRTTFALPKAKPGDYTAPWKLKLDAGGEALIYLNGTLVGRYSDRGPQTEFYLPECWLNFGGKKNAVTIALRDGNKAAALRSLSVDAYPDYTTRRVPITVEY